MQPLSKHLYLPILLVLLSACATLGLSTPRTFNESLTASYSSLDTIVVAGDAALLNGSLSKADATQTLKLVDDVKPILDSARTIHDAGDIAGGQAKLAMAAAALTAVDTYLNSKRKLK